MLILDGFISGEHPLGGSEPSGAAGMTVSRGGRSREHQEFFARMLRSPSNTRPALWRLEKGGLQAVVKDFGVNHRLYRNTVGRFLVWRERKALRRLAGVPGVPPLYGVIDGIAIVTGEVFGRNLENLELEQRLEPVFFERLKETILRCHDRGMAHCDLKRAANIMVGEDGQPYVIDWGASISRREFPFFPLSWVFRRFQQDDLQAVVKMQLRHCPESVDEPEKARLFKRSLPERALRRLRDRLREFLQRVA